MFFFKQKTAYEMRISYWSSDVCSSDLTDPGGRDRPGVGAEYGDPGCRPRCRRGGGSERRAIFGRSSPAARSLGYAGVCRNPCAAARGDAAGGRGRRARGGPSGRASCRDRVGQEVSISVVAVSLKKTK